ncbi:hypothetical protein PROFUN_03494 [Planoprotostelium fungivorum]|uniref:RGS domain-containing protein n=1 Tax=Planoprotostelium fungivorum TaxID=1890364 RepID=A0A2P6MNA2_9EUKA|nr:hypothetical protein PROFUN_03494 [Planoprotostelium fungivorum]
MTHTIHTPQTNCGSETSLVLFQRAELCVCGWISWFLETTSRMSDLLSFTEFLGSISGNNTPISSPTSGGTVRLKRNTTSSTASSLSSESNYETSIGIHKERLHRFDDANKELLKSFERYSETMKEKTLLEGLRAVLDEQPDGVMNNYVHLLQNVSEQEQRLSAPMIETLTTRVKAVKKKCEMTHTAIKKRLNEDADRLALSEDLEVWNEQKCDVYDSLIVLLLRQRGSKQTISFSTLESAWAMSNSSLDQDADAMTDDLSKLINNPVGVHYFKNFLYEELSSENLDFIQEVDRLRKSREDVATQTTTIHKIYREYLDAKAPKLLNVSADIIHRARIEINSHKGDGHSNSKKSSRNSILPLSSKIFDPAYKEVFNMIDKDSFRRFRRSNQCKRLQRKLSCRAADFRKEERHDKSPNLSSSSSYEFDDLAMQAPPAITSPNGTIKKKTGTVFKTMFHKIHRRPSTGHLWAETEDGKPNGNTMNTE